MMYAVFLFFMHVVADVDDFFMLSFSLSRLVVFFRFSCQVRNWTLLAQWWMQQMFRTVAVCIAQTIMQQLQHVTITHV
jgi:hypothetical protein